MNEFIKNLISVNKEATKNIIALESVIQNIKVTTEKDKANFGNLCIVDSKAAIFLVASLFTLISVLIYSFIIFLFLMLLIIVYLIS